LNFGFSTGGALTFTDSFGGEKGAGFDVDAPNPDNPVLLPNLNPPLTADFELSCENPPTVL